MKHNLKFRTNIDNNFNHAFNNQLIGLVIPIVLQNLISVAVNSADIVMLGMINQSVMSAVSLAGQVTFVLTLFYMALSTGTGILTAQYWGKNDKRSIQSVFSISCMFSFSISVVFFIITLCFPKIIMSILTNDIELINFGAKFLRMLSFSYLGMGLSQMYISVLKSMENARLSAGISSIGLIVNILLNSICIFILFPNIPEKVIMGVGVSTICARFMELGCCIIHSVTYGKIKFKLPVLYGNSRSLFKDYLKYTMPVQANYIVWGCALTATTTIIGHVNTDMVAANSVASVVKNMAIVLCGGIANGGSVLVGKYLGSGDKKMAKRAGDRINLYALIFSVASGIVILLMKPVIFQILNLSNTAQGYLNGMLYICAYYCIGKSINSTNIGGIFCAGGDLKFGFWCDTVVMWGIILPLSYMCAFVWQVHPIVLYAVISLDEIIKIPASVIRYSQQKWLNNITRDFI